eukprot:Skav213915  [mRNA]  locus=scaffold1439:237838:241983:- [translate_table: standard]
MTIGCNAIVASVEDTQLVMTDRKGFVKISIENGLDIIPGFCFGEKSVPKGVAILFPTMMTWHIMAHDETSSEVDPSHFQPATFFAEPLATIEDAASAVRLRGRGLTLMGFLEPSLGFVWGEPIKAQGVEGGQGSRRRQAAARGPGRGGLGEVQGGRTAAALVMDVDSRTALITGCAAMRQAARLGKHADALQELQNGCSDIRLPSKVTRMHSRQHAPCFAIKHSTTPWDTATTTATVPFLEAADVKTLI